MSENLRVRVKENVFAREFDGEVVIVDLEGGRYYGLDEVGTRAWSGLIAGKSLGEIASVLVDEYEVERSVLVSDLVALVRELEQRELVDTVT